VEIEGKGMTVVGFLLIVGAALLLALLIRSLFSDGGTSLGSSRAS
jgi:hypothetical protein